MSHICTIIWQKEFNKSLNKVNCFQYFKRKLQLCILISPENSLGRKYFKSEDAIRNEQKRQLGISSCVIHPYSVFRTWYTVYLIYLYLSVLITKPLEAAFFKRRFYKEIQYYKEYSLAVDVLSWIDIAINFFTGYVTQKRSTVILNPIRIARKYVFGPYFICDVLSSIPRSAFYYRVTTLKVYQIYGVLAIFSQFKLIRLVTLIVCINRTADYFHIMSKGVLFLFSSLIVSLTIIHWMACLQYLVPRVTRTYFGEYNYTDLTSWTDLPHIQNAKLSSLYITCFFKSSAYILGMHLELFKLKRVEDYLVTIFIYIVGKILLAFIWIILAVTILRSRTLEIKFFEIIGQLEAYLKRKNVPINISDRLLQYYHSAYGEKYFREEIIGNSLSSTLRNEINLHVCKSLIASISLFSKLSSDEVSKVVEYLRPEIFLPRDTIIQHGENGEAMYFVSSGTVAVYTRSGKEICHLQEGSYFGEISLIMKGQKRTATVIAIETTHVYRLNEKDFKRCLLRNVNIVNKMFRHAERRLNENLEIEELYRKTMYRRDTLFNKTSLHKKMSRIVINIIIILLIC
ncbi:hypothetical protein NQ314_002746 [Rhamnusium bicolor]|uniref:Cyclic nucleotide-binding domain-containing protein n=1 Tax=Rhamnusium bicolor TaxID=1586634 RepID=A0AAV8ZNI6_9CUCU|nr:hypothetical protein NQ314_002746 [Rhamnusium bicolor]